MPRLCVTSAPRPASTAPARAAGAPTVPPPFHSGPGAKVLAGCSVGDGTAAVRGRKGGAAAEWWRAHAQGPHPCGHEPSQWLQPTDEHFSEYVGVNELFWYFSNLRNPISFSSWRPPCCLRRSVSGGYSALAQSPAGVPSAVCAPDERTWHLRRGDCPIFDPLPTTVLQGSRT